MFWSAYAWCYDQIWDTPLTDGVAQWVIDQIPSGASVTECGAGTGLITGKLIAAGISVTASEPERAMRSRFEAALPGVPIHDLRCEDLSPGEDRIVVAVNVLHMTQDPTEALATLRTAAGQSGRVIVTVPAPNASVPEVARAMRRAGSARWEVLRFIWLHALLAPLTVATNHGVKPLQTNWSAEAVRVEEINAVQTGAVFRGR
jgi:hypothetical protein